jgi:hypothetical protein
MTTIDLIIFVTGTHNAVCISAEPCVPGGTVTVEEDGKDGPRLNLATAGPSLRIGAL